MALTSSKKIQTRIRINDKDKNKVIKNISHHRREILKRKEETTMSKISTRFYNDRRVRAVWDDENSRWFFSVVDIVAAITESPNPRKYWSVLKTRLRKSGDELTTVCSQLKLRAADGKHRLTYVRRALLQNGGN